MRTLYKVGRIEQTGKQKYDKTNVLKIFILL